MDTIPVVGARTIANGRNRARSETRGSIAMLRRRCRTEVKLLDAAHCVSAATLGNSPTFLCCQWAALFGVPYVVPHKKFWMLCAALTHLGRISQRNLLKCRWLSGRPDAERPVVTRMLRSTHHHHATAVVPGDIGNVRVAS